MVSNSIKGNDVNCVFADCDSPAVGRGLCAAHYQTARNLVKSQMTSWEELEMAGKAKPRVRRAIKQFFLN